jgi:hypothetical protein
MPDSQASNSSVLTAEARTSTRKSCSSLAAALAVAAFLVAALAYWFYLDHHIPTADEAGHILSSLKYQDVYRHLRPWQQQWWQQFLTVSSFYPPTTYIVGGIFKIILNGSRSADALIQCISMGVLSLSTFACARYCGLSVLGAAISGLVIGLYPANNYIGHTFMLDLPLASAVAFGVVLLKWWQTKPGYRRAALAGLGLSFACLTKQIAACYLFPAGLYVLVSSWLAADKSSRLRRIGQLTVMVLTTVLVALPWILLNAGTTSELAAYNRKCLAAATSKVVQTGFSANLINYLQLIAMNCSPFLLVAAVLSILVAGPERHKKMGFITCLGVGGILILCTANWFPPLERYAMPALIPLAVFTGLGCQLLIERKSFWAKSVAAVFLCLALTQWLVSNYMPYPLSSNKTLSDLVAVLRGLPADSPALHSCPERADAQGVEEIVDLIKKVDGVNPSFLDILLNEGGLNAHTFELLVREKKAAVLPTTFLQWTLVGDKIEFSEEKCLYCKWHLINSGPHGYSFFNTDSEKSWNKFREYISKSGKFEPRWSRHLPDGQTLTLYMRVP